MRQWINNTGAGKTGMVEVQEFDSITELMEFSEKPTRINQYLHKVMGDYPSYTKSNNLTWYGLEDGAAGVRGAVKNGWSDGVNKMLKAMKDIEGLPQPVSIRRKRTRGDFGDSLDITRVWSGDISTAWDKCSRQAMPRTQIVTIAAGLSAHHKTSASQLFWRGAAALKLTDILTQAGYSVEIIGYRAVSMAFEKTHKAAHLVQTVVVKESSMPVDLSSLASSLCLAGFNRLFLMSAHCCSEGEAQGYMGYSQQLSYFGMQNDSHLCGLEYVVDAESARGWVAGQMEILNTLKAAA